MPRDKPAAHFVFKLRLAYRSTLSPAELGAPARAHRQELKMSQAFSTPEPHSPEPMLADAWANAAHPKKQVNGATYAFRALWNLTWCSFDVVRAATIIHCMNPCEKGAMCRLVWV